MADITLTIPNNYINDVIEAFVQEYSYKSTIDGAPNPQTPAQFTKAQVIEFVKQVVKRYKMRVAADSAASTASAGVDSALTIT